MYVLFWDLTFLFLDDTNLINSYVPNIVMKALFVQSCL